MTTRRKFLTQAGLAAAGLMTLPALAGLAGALNVTGGSAAGKALHGAAPHDDATAAARKKGMIGLQLYSLRDQLPLDVKGWIAKVSQAGYTNVETFGLSEDSKYWGLDPASFKSLLQDNHLVSTSGHYGMDEYLIHGTEGDLKKYIDAIHALGQTYLTIPYLNADIRKTEDDWKAIAAKFNAIGTRLKSEGIKLGYHNHNFEFAPVGNTRGLDILLQNTDPSLVHFESDLYWVVRGGADPIDLFHKYPGRFVMWHLKDMDKAQTDLNTEIGNGSIDFKKIFQYAKLAGLQQTFMEQENYSAGMDPYTSISQSAAYIKNNLVG